LDLLIGDPFPAEWTDGFVDPSLPTPVGERAADEAALKMCLDG
jgi:hypothetical protein